MISSEMLKGIAGGMSSYQLELVIAVTLSVLGYYVCQTVIPKVMIILFERNIYGIDINKSTKEKREEFGKMRKRSSNAPLGGFAGSHYRSASMVHQLGRRHLTKRQNSREVRRESESRAVWCRRR